jgi:4-amino-4-deoxy-L-arabinose transferase-like glycosyltransferase
VIRKLILGLAILGTLVLWFARQQSNPPGFYVDESSIAYNALSIARAGADEHDVRFPLYFEAFGEYKNPVYIYALAAVFKVVHPSNLVARRFSAICGYLAALACGWLAWRVTRRPSVMVIVAAMALATPTLFEISRLAFEVALYPLILAVFLIFAHAFLAEGRWDWKIATGLLITLVLLTYTYSIGRLLAPLLALGLLVFAPRARRRNIVLLCVAFALLGVVPIAVYNHQHDGAMTFRALTISYIPNDLGRPAVLLADLERHYIDNILPFGYSLVGDLNTRHHMKGAGGSILVVTWLLAILGIVVAPRTRWYWFLLFGLAATVLPAAVTNDQFHSLRLVAYPLFLIALAIPAVEWLLTRRVLLIAALLIGALQAAWFFVVFERHGGERAPEFDAGARQIVGAAIDQSRGQPVYVVGTPYVHAWWYGALRGVDRSRFVRATFDDTAPHGALVIGQPCDGCEVVARSGSYTLFRMR